MNIDQDFVILLLLQSHSSVGRSCDYRLSFSHIICVGLYLTDVTFCREGNPNFRASPTNSSKKLLNFNKYHKLARIVQGWCLGIVKGLLSECVA